MRGFSTISTPTKSNFINTPTTVVNKPTNLTQVTQVHNKKHKIKQNKTFPHGTPVTSQSSPPCLNGAASETWIVDKYESEIYDALAVAV